MDFLRRRKLALVLFIVVVVVFSLLSAHRSLNRRCRRVEAAFFDRAAYTGTASGYTAPSEHLQSAARYANNVLSDISGCDELTECYVLLRDARVSLIDALDAADIEASLSSYAALRDAADTLAAQVSAGAAIPAGSRANYETDMTNLSGALNALERSPYNAMVEDFLRTTIEPFPANVLRVLSGVRLPAII